MIIRLLNSWLFCKFQVTHWGERCGISQFRLSKMAWLCTLVPGFYNCHWSEWHSFSNLFMYPYFPSAENRRTQWCRRGVTHTEWTTVTRTYTIYFLGLPYFPSADKRRTQWCRRGMTHTEWPTVTRTYNICFLGPDAPKQVTCGLDHSVILTVGGQEIIPIVLKIIIKITIMILMMTMMMIILMMVIYWY